MFCHFNASDAKHSDQSLPNHSYSRLSSTFSSPHSKPSSSPEFLLQLTLCIIYTWANCCAFATAQMRVLGRGEWQTWHSRRMRIMMMSIAWAAAQADDAANELLPDFQWHSTAAEATAATAKATATTRAAASKCDMSRDLNWRCCRKCALICQRTLPNTPIPRQASL